MEQLSYNLDKFSSGETKILFVLGLPESGKTDMIKNVFEVHDDTCQIYNTDELYDLWKMDEEDFTDKELLKSFYENMIKWIFPVENSAFMRESIIPRESYKLRVLELFIRWCRLHDTNSRVIIESTDILTFGINPEFMRAYDFALIVLGDNIWDCAKRYARRLTIKKWKRLYLRLKFVFNADYRTIRGLNDYQIFCMDNDKTYNIKVK